MKRILAVIIVVSSLLLSGAVASPAQATNKNRVHVELVREATAIVLDAERGQIVKSGDGFRVGPDVEVISRERGSDEIVIVRPGQWRARLVLWHPTGITASTTSEDDVLWVHLTKHEAPGPATSGTVPTAPITSTSPPAPTPPAVPAAPPTTTPPATTPAPMDHGSMDHTSTASIKPVVVPSDPVTPYVTPFKASVTQRSQIGFSVSCDRSHTAKDDPIVFPGQPGRAHLHDFFGSTVTDAFSTVADLRAGPTSCSATDDKSAYWAPALFANGVALEPTNTTFYYKPGVEDRSAIKPIPYGLEVVAGNAGATGPQNGQYFWFEEFRNASNNTGDGVMIRATTSGRITLKVVYPDCWDGQRLSAPDQSHVAYHTNKRTCPSSHPVPMPQLTMFVTYGTNGDGVSLASGAWYTMHADFFNAWTPATQQRLIDECVKPAVRCGGVYDADSTRIPRRG